MPVLGPKETVVFIIFGTFLAKVVALWNTRRDFEWHTVLVTVFGSYSRRLRFKCHTGGVFTNFTGHNAACRNTFNGQKI